VLVELFFFGGWIRFFCILFCALLYPPLHAFFPCGIYSARVILYDDIFCIERFLLRTLVPPSSDMVRSGRAPKAKLHTYISSLMISFWLIENGLFFLSKPCHSCFTPLYHKSDLPKLRHVQSSRMDTWNSQSPLYQLPSFSFCTSPKRNGDTMIHQNVVGTSSYLLTHTHLAVWVFQMTEYENDYLASDDVCSLSLLSSILRIFKVICEFYFFSSSLV